MNSFRSAFLIFTLTVLCTTAFGAPEVLSKKNLIAVSGVDLGIADDETFSRPNSWALKNNSVPSKAGLNTWPNEIILGGGFSGPASRPGISIAWRNAAQVEEVEVRVRNLGKTPGIGRIFVNILDGSGAVLLKLEPPEEFKTIRIPAFADGGREGKILRMKSSRELNNIIDSFDRTLRRYDVRATVETVGALDANPYDNSKTKSWNVEHRVEPKQMSVMNYLFKNNESEDVTVHWQFERTPYPKGWVVKGSPVSSKPFVLKPQESVIGNLWMLAPEKIDEGAFLESRLTLVNTKTREAWQQREWFLAHDSVPPTVTDYRMVATADHKIAIQALVADQGSGVREATGVSTQYSTDGGLTWSTKAHNYKAGNFVVPTLFEVVLGPFTQGTKLQMRFTAKDTVGNAVTIIPSDAIGIIAPPGTEKLLELGHVFPRTQPNAIFYLQPGNLDIAQIANQFSSGLLSNSQSDALKVEDVENVVRDMKITSEGKRMLIDTAKSLSNHPTKSVAAARLRDLLENMPIATSAAQINTVPLELKRIETLGESKLGNMTTLQLTVP